MLGGAAPGGIRAVDRIIIAVFVTSFTGAGFGKLARCADKLGGWRAGTDVPGRSAGGPYGFCRRGPRSRRRELPSPQGAARRRLHNERFRHHQRTHRRAGQHD